MQSFAAVSRFIEPAIAAAGPERTLRRNKNRIGVPRVDANHADVAATDIFARTGPDRVWVIGVYRQSADGAGAFLIENWISCRTGID